MAFSIIAISSLFLYINNNLEKSNSTINDVIDLKVQTNNILKSLHDISDVEMRIVLAKELDEFDSIDEEEFEEIGLIDKINLKSDIDLKKYNKSLEEMKRLFLENVEIKESMSELSYSIISYEKGILESLILMEEEMSKIIRLAEAVSGKIKLSNKRNNRKLTRILKKEEVEIKEVLPKILEVLVGNKDKLSRNINNLQKSVLNLILIGREISISNSKDKLNDIKTNKIAQATTLLEKEVATLLRTLKNKELEEIVLSMGTHIIKIGELQKSLITLKEFSFSQKNRLNSLMDHRKSVNNELLVNIEVLSKIAKETSNSIVNSFKETSEKTILYIIVIILLVALFLFSFGWILLTRVNRPLEHITKSIENISEEKDNLHENIKVGFNDEFKKLVNVFNKMTSTLSKNIKKLKKREKEISILNKDLEKRVELRTKQLSEKTEKITNLFNNVKQGFLSFDENLIVDDEYSIECEKLLGKDIKGNNVADLLYIKHSDKKEFFKRTLVDIFNAENEVIQDSYISLLPRELILNKRALSIDYIKLSDNKCMMILTNITAQKKLEQKVKKEQQILKMIVTIVSDKEQFTDVLEEYKEFNEQKLNIFELNNSILLNLSELYRDIHTYKGLFSQFYMVNIVKKLHTFETEISEYIKDKEFSNDDLKYLLEENDFYSWLDSDLDIINSVLGESFAIEDTIFKVNEKSILKLEEKINDYCSLDKKNSDNYEDILYETQKLRSRTLIQSLQNYPRLCMDLADKLDKQIYPFEILGDETITLPPNFKPFIKSLVHVFRNLIDHGIEDAESRIEKNKDENGTIVCSFAREDDSLVILISDDGQGINKEKIKKKVIENNILSSEEFDKMNDERIFGFIFYESFSTNEDITDVSGRGIGMSAVKNELVKIKGKVEVKSVLEKGTTFIFKLPYRREGTRNV